MFKDIENELMHYWKLATGADKEYDETIGVFKKWTKTAKRQKALRKKKAVREAPNWNSLKPKTGYKRIKEGNRYIRVRMSGKEKVTRKKLGKYLGKKYGKNKSAT